MLTACRELHPYSDVVIGVAAVSDYRPAETCTQKRKKASAPWEVRLVPTEDILAQLGRHKGNRIHVGFALETENLLENARKKLREKRLDCLVANPAEAIGSASSNYHLIDAGDVVRDLGTLTKKALAKILCDDIAHRARYRPPKT